MDDERRDLINHLGSELAGILDDTSFDAATLRGVADDRLETVIATIKRAADRAHAIAMAMIALSGAMRDRPLSPAVTDD